MLIDPDAFETGFAAWTGCWWPASSGKWLPSMARRYGTLLHGYCQKAAFQWISDSADFEILVLSVG